MKVWKKCDRIVTRQDRLFGDGTRKRALATIGWRRLKLPPRGRGLKLRFTPPRVSAFTLRVMSQAPDTE